MRSTFEFCIPTTAKQVPAGPDWLHEIKYDGYRPRLVRDGRTVRLIPKSGLDWTKRYPWIVESALKNRKTQFMIDGEIVVHGVDGISDINALHSLSKTTLPSSTPSTAWCWLARTCGSSRFI